MNSRIMAALVLTLVVGLAVYFMTVNWTNFLVAAVVGSAIVILNARFIVANIRLSRLHDAMSA